MLSNKVREIMNREVITTASSTAILDTVKTMAGEKVGRVVVVEDENPLGIFTDNDLLQRVMHRRINVQTASVKKVMTTPIRWVREDANLIDALGKMYRGKFCHMLVRNETGKILGLVSIRRILKVAVEAGQGARKARKVGSIMSGRPFKVDASSSIFDSIKGMLERDSCAALVMEKKRLKGIFTSRDILNRVAGKDIDTKKTAVKAVMTANPVILSASESVNSALSKMRDGNFRHLPIRNEKGDIAGVVTMSGVLKYAKVLDMDGTVRRTWREIKEFWEAEDQYTPG